MNKIDYILDRKFTFRLDNGKLRIIAMCAMFLDHFAFMIIGNGILYGYKAEVYNAALQTELGQKWYIIYLILRSVGRIAFPMFCFLLVEGFVHTKNLFKYLVRLFMLAIISEIPFDLMCGNCLIYLDKQNVIFTFILALLMLFLIKKIANLYYIYRAILTLIIVGLSCVIAHLCKLDHDYPAIILIFLMYNFYTDKNMKILFTGIMSFFMSFVETGSFRYYGVGALCVLPLYIYNGKIGSLSKHKTFYYLFYPLHMIILYGVVFITYLR